jgi:hypothetical protein
MLSVDLAGSTHDSSVYNTMPFSRRWKHDWIKNLTANFLQHKSHRLSDGTDCLSAAMEIVDEKVKWLQPKRMKKIFQWETDIHEYMFVVGVMMDSTGSCQHVITIFRNWIHDSNEPFALPLSKESIDCCTWTVKDGDIQEASLFVSFLLKDGFSKKMNQKRKMLDVCAYAASWKKQLQYYTNSKYIHIFITFKSIHC